MENPYHQKIALSFYLENGVQIGRFLSLLIKSTTSATKILFLIRYYAAYIKSDTINAITDTITPMNYQVTASYIY